MNKLNSLVKSMAEKAGIENNRLRNHSGRKAMVQSESDVPPAHIAQLSGHKNLKSIQNYSSVSTNQHMHMSKLLSGLVAGNSSSSSTKPAACSSSLSSQKQDMDLFSAAVIQGGNFIININTLNQSPTLSVNSAAKQTWKRLKPLDSDSSIRKRGSMTGGAGGAPSTTRDVMTVFFTS